MTQTYQEIWKLSKPYYEKARPTDAKHIKWMMKEAMLICKKENIDDSLLMPLVILHDIGYFKIPKEDYFKINVRKKHMEEGAKIAKEILENVGYPKEKINKIVYYISIHDIWALEKNDVYEDIILGTFNDLDFIWTATLIGFSQTMKALNKSPEKIIYFLENDDKLTKRPFQTETVKKLHKGYVNKRKKELK